MLTCLQVIEDYFFSHETFSMQRHFFFTTVILVASMAGKRILISLVLRADSFPVALITCDLGVMLEITGGVSATTLAFIFPAACYLQLAAPTAPWYARAKLPAVLCAAFGAGVLAISLFLALGKAWTPAGKATICVG